MGLWTDCLDLTLLTLLTFTILPILLVLACGVSRVAPTVAVPHSYMAYVNPTRQAVLVGEI